MDRRNFFFKQKVQESELDAAFTGAEDALHALASDFAYTGVTFGLEVEENDTPDLNVKVLGPGAAYDQLGERVATPSTQLVDVSVDSSAVSTDVVTPGNEKIVSVFIKFKRAESDPRIDGNSATVYFINDESFEFVVAQGEESTPPATPVDLLSDAILLADITRTEGQTTIVNADIDAGAGSRRQDQFVVTGSAIDEIRAGNVQDAFLALVAEIDAFIAGSAAAIAYAGGPAWADGTTNPATDVEAQLDKIVDDLGGTSFGHSGTSKIYGDAIFDSPDTVNADTLRAQLERIVNMTNDRLSLFGGTMSGNIVPSVTGRVLGSSGARWDIFGRTLNVSGTSTLTGAVTASGGFVNDFAYTTPVTGRTYKIPLSIAYQEGAWAATATVDGNHFPTALSITRDSTAGQNLLLVPIPRASLPQGLLVTTVRMYCGSNTFLGSTKWSLIGISKSTASIISLHSGGGHETIALNITPPAFVDLTLTGTAGTKTIDHSTYSYYLSIASADAGPELRELIVIGTQDKVLG